MHLLHFVVHCCVVLPSLTRRLVTGASSAALAGSAQPGLLASEQSHSCSFFSASWFPVVQRHVTLFMYLSLSSAASPAQMQEWLGMQTHSLSLGRQHKSDVCACLLL